jgi:hypothetical protein
MIRLSEAPLAIEPSDLSHLPRDGSARRAEQLNGCLAPLPMENPPPVV